MHVAPHPHRSNLLRVVMSESEEQRVAIETESFRCTLAAHNMAASTRGRTINLFRTTGGFEGLSLLTVKDLVRFPNMGKWTAQLFQSLGLVGTRRVAMGAASVAGEELRAATVGDTASYTLGYNQSLLETIAALQSKLVDPAAEKLNALLYRTLDEFEFSVRVAHGLQSANIKYVGELAQKTEDEMRQIPNFGRLSLREVQHFLADLGLRLGMKFKDWPGKTNAQEQRLWKNGCPRVVVLPDEDERPVNVRIYGVDNGRSLWICSESRQIIRQSICGNHPEATTVLFACEDSQQHGDKGS